MKKFKVLRRLNDPNSFEDAVGLYLSNGWKIVNVQMMVFAESGLYDVAYLEKEEDNG